MSRVKRAIDLAVMVAFVLLCFVLSYLFNAVSGMSYGNQISFAEKGKATVAVQNGAEATCGVENGLVFVDVQKAGSAYNDVAVTLQVGDIAYDVAYLEEAMGEKNAAEHKDYLDALSAGPWLGSVHQILMGDDILTEMDENYSFVDAEGEEISQRVASNAANTAYVSEKLNYEKGGKATATFYLGTAKDGPLPTGKYYIDAKLTLSSGVGELDLPTGVRLGMLGDVMGDTLANTPFTSFFQVSSLMTFYGMMCAFAIVFFLYPDLRAAIKIFLLVWFYGASSGRKYMVHTFVNGIYQGTREYNDGDGAGIFMGLIAFMLSYMALTLLIPIRILIYIVKDIYYLIVGEEEREGFPLLGNILGSIGAYLLLVALVGFTAAWNTVVMIICAVAGIALVSIAAKLCKDADDLASMIDV